MPSFNLKVNKTHTYDAIVIGSGISGGWAAKELCEKGLQTLVLERGRMVRHVEDYPTMNKDHWDFEHRGKLTDEDKKKYHIQVRSGFIDESNKHFYNNDLDSPYTEVKRFDWIRGNQASASRRRSGSRDRGRAAPWPPRALQSARRAPEPRPRGVLLLRVDSPGGPIEPAARSPAQPW